MGRLEPGSEKKFFRNKKSEVNDYNKKVFISLTSFSFICTLLISVISFYPVFQSVLWPRMVFPVKLACIISAVLYGSGIFMSLFARKTLNAHPLFFVYLVFIVAYVLSIFINLSFKNPIPFILMGIYRLLFPVIVLDYKRRQNIVFYILTILAIFVISYKHKPLDIFFMDIITAVIYTSLGGFLSNHFLNSQIKSTRAQDEQVDRIREVEKAKGEAKIMFLAHMSHEIRTPLNSILGLNEIILRETKESNTREYATNIMNSGNTLLKIVNDVLDFSKIETGKMNIVAAEYDISSTITDLTNMVSQKARDKNIELLINVDENLPHKLFGDELRLKQCMLNILNNAVKFTEKGSVRLDIGFDKIDGGQIMLKVKVKDTGIGIRPEDLEKLCSEFERLDENRNRTIEGSGLGLNIVGNLLQMMDSKLEVSSEYGKGSVFSFNVPQQVIWWEKIGDFNQRYEKLLKSASDYHEMFRAPDAKVLVVDDTKMNIVVFRGLLKKTEIQVDEAFSGLELLEKIKEKQYDVIFIDHRMPGMSGVEAFHKMQLMEGHLNQNVPCIALTANVVSGARDYYLHEGFKDYISKPVNSSQLETLLEKYIPMSKRQKAVGSEETEKKQKNLEERLSSLEGISLPTALQNCGSLEVLVVAIKEYYATIKKRADDIEDFARERNYREYTVQVHSLKSSSKLIGALELSEKAAYLEKCGDEENALEISKKTPELLSLYRSYITKLDSFAEKIQGQKEMIDPNRFNEAMAAIKEFADVFDFNAIDDIVEEVDKFTVPPEMVDKFNEIKRLARAADFNGLKEILNLK